MWSESERREVAGAIIKQLSSWPSPDILDENLQFRTILILWDRPGDVCGAVVGEKMISVFWKDHHEAAATADEAIRMLERSGVLSPFRLARVGENQMVDPPRSLGFAK